MGESSPLYFCGSPAYFSLGVSSPSCPVFTSITPPQSPILLDGGPLQASSVYQDFEENAIFDQQGSFAEQPGVSFLETCGHIETQPSGTSPPKGRIWNEDSQEFLIQVFTLLENKNGGNDAQGILIPWSDFSSVGWPTSVALKGMLQKAQNSALEIQGKRLELFFVCALAKRAEKGKKPDFGGKKSGTQLPVDGKGSLNRVYASLPLSVNPHDKQEYKVYRYTISGDGAGSAVQYQRGTECAFYSVRLQEKRRHLFPDCERPKKRLRPMPHVITETWAAQKKRKAFLNAVEMAEPVEVVERLGQECAWPSVKDFYEKFSRSPLHLAVSMLDRSR
eukprot:jgi/Botrbrau1/918/Bobra.0167s0032.2